MNVFGFLVATDGKFHLSTWSKEEVNESTYNSKGLNAIFMSISPEEFKRISICEIAFDAQKILETTREGTVTVKNSKLQMLTTKFEEIRMKDDETFDEFYAKLNGIVNSSFILGEKIPESRVVQKVMRPLPERFRPKVTAIEESKDLTKMKIEELVGSLQTYELTLPLQKKNKKIALKSSKEEAISEDDDDEILDDEQFDLFVKHSRKLFKSKGIEGKFNKGAEKPQGSSNDYRKEIRDKHDLKTQCFECQGFWTRSTRMSKLS